MALLPFFEGDVWVMRIEKRVREQAAKRLDKVETLLQRMERKPETDDVGTHAANPSEPDPGGGDAGGGGS
jgi:hypothetical protein